MVDFGEVVRIDRVGAVGAQHDEALLAHPLQDGGSGVHGIGQPAGWPPVLNRAGSMRA